MSKIVTVKDDLKGDLNLASDKIFYVLDNGTDIIVSYDNGKKIGRNRKVDSIASDSSNTYATIAAFIANTTGLVSFTPLGDLESYDGLAINYKHIVNLVPNGSDTDVHINNLNQRPFIFTVDGNVAAITAAIEAQRNADVVNV